MASIRTQALCQHDEKLRTLTTKVVSVTLASALSEAARLLFKQALETDHVVATSETIFYAQGGGQPSDTGVISSSDVPTDTFSVTSVRNGPDGQILHLGRFSNRTFAPGETVSQAIDGAKRDLNSRIHTGGHIVGLAVRHLAASIPGVTELKAQHYPDTAFVEFQGSIDGKHKDAIQTKANEFVEQAMPVKVYWWTEEEIRANCAAVPENVAMPQDELIRAVDIEGAGAYPCGGTHVPDTSFVGKITVRKISRQKGNTKVSYMIA